MTVADLEIFLRSLSTMLAPNAKAVAGELDFVCEKLVVFREMKIKAFGEFLEKAEAYSRGALAPKTKKPAAPKKVKDPDRPAKLLAAARHWFEHALDPETTPEAVETEIRAFNDLTKPQLEAVAKDFDLFKKFKNKPEILDGIIRRILDRRGMHQRSLV
jgi:hypothetical protein